MKKTSILNENRLFNLVFLTGYLNAKHNLVAESLATTENATHLYVLLAGGQFYHFGDKRSADDDDMEAQRAVTLFHDQPTRFDDFEIGIFRQRMLSVERIIRECLQNDL